MQTRVSRQNPHGHSGSVHDCSGRQLRAFFQVEEHLGDHARQPLGSMQGAHIGGQIGMDDALGAVEGFNNKAKLTTKKAYGFRSYEVVKIALYHTLGDLPQPMVTHKFC